MSNKSNCFIGIIDLKVNNLFSIYKACVLAGYKAEVINPKYKLSKYDMVLLPGVGSFKTGMDFLKKEKLNEKIMDYLNKKNSFIYGICLGMQLFFDSSSEFLKSNGLGLIKGEVTKFKKSRFDNNINIGWDKIKSTNKDFNKVFKNYLEEEFYFVHSYYCNPKKNEEKVAYSMHGNLKFTSIVKKEKIFGTQFHPEKSGKNGINFLKKIKHII